MMCSYVAGIMPRGVTGGEPSSSFKQLLHVGYICIFMPWTETFSKGINQDHNYSTIQELCFFQNDI